MREKLQKYFSLTDKGARNILKSTVYSFFKFLTFTFAPILVFVFLKDYLSENLKSIYVYFLIYLLIVIVIFFVLKKEYTLNYDTTYEQSAEIRINIANQFIKLPLSYFSKHNLTDLSQNIMLDVNNIEMAISHSVSQGLGFLYFFILLSIAMIISNPILGLATVLPIYISMLLMFLTRKIQSKDVEKYYDQVFDNSAKFQEIFEMQQEIKSYNLKSQFKDNMDKSLDSLEKIHMKSEFKMATISCIIQILPFISPIIVAIVGAKMYTNMSIDLIYYLGFLICSTTISKQYLEIQEFILMILFFGSSFKRIRDIYSEEIQVGKDIKINNFDIELNNVSFSYEKDLPKVIDDVSFVAKQGEVTALVGLSGCGKSTILKLISRLYDYDSGSIKIGGNNINEISSDSLFDNISIVFQNVELFNDTIMENVRIGRKDASNSEVLEAIKLANVDKFAEKLDNKLESVIGENGHKLSGGQRQRISIARALLKNSPIILLDEISSALDVENEFEIQQGINSLIKNKTVIVISHRLKSIENADKIVIIDKGKVIAVGKHNELLEKSETYRNMIEKSMISSEFIY